MADKPEWTDDEIEKICDAFLVPAPMREAFDKRLRAALSAVPRAPAGQIFISRNAIKFSQLLGLWVVDDSAVDSVVRDAWRKS